MKVYFVPKFDHSNGIVGDHCLGSKLASATLQAETKEHQGILDGIFQQKLFLASTTKVFSLERISI